jgi:hypothetical protein
MMKVTFVFSMGAMAASLLSFANPGNGMDLDPDKALHDWEVQRLMEPSSRELEKERKGSVYIYDRLTGREVDTALDTQFSRIENMMFVGTVKTDPRGEPLQEAKSGQYIQESGGCGD